MFLKESGIWHWSILQTREGDMRSEFRLVGFNNNQTPSTVWPGDDRSCATSLYRFFLRHCTPAEKGVGTIWQDVSKAPHRRQGPLNKHSRCVSYRVEYTFVLYRIQSHIMKFGFRLLYVLYPNNKEVVVCSLDIYGGVFIISVCVLFIAALLWKVVRFGDRLYPSWPPVSFRWRLCGVALFWLIDLLVYGLWHVTDWAFSPTIGGLSVWSDS